MALRVLSWNVQNVPYEGRGARRHRRIAKLLADIGADFCCLQEVHPHLRDSLQALLPNYRLFGENRSSLTYDESVPVLINRHRYQVLQAKTFWLGPHESRWRRAWDAHHPRCATAVQVQDASGEVYNVLSCHLDHRGRRSRLHGAEQVLTWAQQRGWRIIGGDLNAGPASPPYRQITASPCLQDAFHAAAVRSGPVATWAGFWGLLRRRLDFLFVDQHLHCRRYHTLSHDRKYRRLSDHRPILADLTLHQSEAT